MATPSSSTSEAVGDLEGYASGYVYPRTDCPHLPSSDPVIHPSNYPSMGAACHSCGSLQENWVCLLCQTVECGRYVNGHMLAHAKSSDHSIAISYSDLSIWCFKCDAYLDAQAIPQLQPIFASIYRLKFGEAPPLVQLPKVTSTNAGSEHHFT